MGLDSEAIFRPVDGSAHVLSSNACGTQTASLWSGLAGWTYEGKNAA